MNFYSEQIFPIINDLFTRSFDRHRKKILISATGKVLEIGFGTGLSLPCYPSTVSEVVGLEPNNGMLKKAKKNKSHIRKVQIVEGVVEHLPFIEKEFDAVVSFLTLCSVINLKGAIAEIKRVLKKPGGKFYFIEHVIQPKGTLTRQLQETIQPIWGSIACGCHLNRNTIQELQTAGFNLEIKRIGYSGFPNILGPIYRGIATLE